MKNLIKQSIPLKFRNKIRGLKIDELFFKFYYRSRLNAIRERIRKKRKINVVFILMDISMWKYEGLYQLMANHSGFDPTILLAPRTNQSEEDIQLSLMEMTTYFTQFNHNIIAGYDLGEKTWYDVNEQINPDIIFYTQPPNTATVDGKYQIRNFKNVLFCYIPYYFLIISQKWAYDSLLQNIAWKLFYPTKSHIQTAKLYAKNKGRNICVTGYSIADELLNPKRPITDPWKNKNPSIKRIIWAPHHSIIEEGALYFANFLQNHQILFDLAEKYKNQIHIAFKPHPVLRTNLYNHKNWGKEKTDSYYRKWNELANGQLETGEYIDLMLTSDAMIHDCVSFTVEYLYTKKPVLYLAKNKHSEKLCAFGQLAFKQHYRGCSNNEIENFIVAIVLGNKDLKLTGRIRFFNKHLLPPNDRSVADNVFNEILLGLGWSDE